MKHRSFCFRCNVAGSKWTFRSVCSVFWCLSYTAICRKEPKQSPCFFSKHCNFCFLQAWTMTSRKCASGLWSVLMFFGLLHPGYARPGKLLTRQNITITTPHGKKHNHKQNTQSWWRSHHSCSIFIMSIFKHLLGDQTDS
jgi:hypothetical protein